MRRINHKPGAAKTAVDDTTESDPMTTTTHDNGMQVASIIAAYLNNATVTDPKVSYLRHALEAFQNADQAEGPADPAALRLVLAAVPLLSSTEPAAAGR